MMLRILISLVLVFAVVWYMLRDGNDNKQVMQEEAEKIDLAKLAIKQNEDASAAMAEQTDAIRDQAMGSAPPDPANPENGGQ